MIGERELHDAMQAYLRATTGGVAVMGDGDGPLAAMRGLLLAHGCDPDAVLATADTFARVPEPSGATVLDASRVGFLAGFIAACLSGAGS